MSYYFQFNHNLFNRHLGSLWPVLFEKQLSTIVLGSYFGPTTYNSALGSLTGIDNNSTYYEIQS